MRRVVIGGLLIGLLALAWYVGAAHETEKIVR